MGDATLEDIMPVELAVQRELAYRRKIAELQPSSGRANFWKTLMPLEEQSSSSGTNSAAGDVLSGIAVQEAPSRHCFLSSPLPRELERQPEFGFFKVRSCSNPRSSSNTVPNSSLTHGLLEMKRQGPTNSLDFFPSHQAHELLHQMDNYFCKTCQVACSSKRNYREHVKGRMHLSKLGELKMRLGRKECGKQYVYEAAPANQRRRCEMCNIWFMDDDLFKEHLSGQKHNAQMAISKSKRAGEETVKVPSRSWCEICGVGGTSEDIERHFGGQKHKAQLLRLERARNVGGGDISKQQWCEICGVGGTIEDIERHFGGQKHKVQLLRLERARNVGGGDISKQLWCEICGVGGTSEDIERHFRGQKHKAQLLRLERASNAGGGDISKQQWCEICGVSGTSEDIERHFGGQKHKAQLLRLERTRNVGGGDISKQQWCSVCDI